MSSTVIAKNVQIGADGTASNNFTIFQPASPDGTLRIGNGNTGITASLVALTSAGNVGIGNTAANVNDQVGAVRPLLVSKSDTSTTIAGSQANVVIGNADTTTNNTSQLSFAAITGGNSTYFASAAINCVFGARTNGQYPTGQLTFSTSTSLNSAPTEKMRIDSSGNVGIGTSSPVRPLQVTSNSAETQLLLRDSDSTGPQLLIGADSAVSGSIINASSVSGSNSNLLLQTAGVERARIDSSGNFFVGKSDVSAAVVGTVITPVGVSRFTNSASSNSVSTLEVYSTGASAFRFYVGYAGTIYATSTSISAISDATLKENVRDLETGLTEVMALRPRRFDWKNGDAQNVAGFVAQEVEQVLPELVTDYVYNKDEDGNDIIKKSLKMGDILPTLVKAIQEQQAIITALTARVTALEGA